MSPMEELAKQEFDVGYSEGELHELQRVLSILEGLHQKAEGQRNYYLVAANKIRGLS